MSDPIQISAKTLAQLAMPDFCPRCFWIRLHNPQLPYQIFPGIFSSIDSYSKRVTTLYFQRHLRLPDWLKPIGLDACPLPVPHWSKFQFIDADTGVKLTGVPDEILRLPGRKAALAILDYKTARYTNAQDALAPLYQAQLNSYSLIASKIGMGRTETIALVYFEPITDVRPEELDDLIVSDTVSLLFDPVVVPVEIYPAMIPAMLRRARELHDLPKPPPGKPDCKDCRLLDDLLKSVPISEAA